MISSIGVFHRSESFTRALPEILVKAKKNSGNRGEESL